MFRKVCLGLFALLVVGGCVVDGSESGVNATVETQTVTTKDLDLDSTKEGALGLIFGMPQIDARLDVEAGDKEDWRYIIVTESGVMSIAMNIDNPSMVDGGWEIIDSEGRTLHRQSFSKTQGYYEFKDFPVKRGIYYFRTFAMSGKSIYTIASSFQPRMTEPAPVSAPMPAPVEDDDPSPSPSPKPKPKPKPKPDPAPAPAPAPAGDVKKIKGFISIITPKSDGSVEITIRDAGKNKGIETGAVGKIEGTNLKIETIQCLATSCRAIIPESANPASLKKGANVVFEVK